MSEYVKIRAAELVEDFALYPRNQVDDTHVSDLVRALASGATMPAIVVDRATKRVVDGVHRKRAFVKFYGDDVEVQVELRDYASEADLYLDAVRFNAQHGRKLDRHDQTRIVLKLQEFQIDERTISAVLHVPPQEVKTLAVRIVYDTSGQAIPQKRGLEHLRGKILSVDQVEAMKTVRSAEVGRLCIELTKLIEFELIDYEDPYVYEKLKQLGQALAMGLKRIRATQAKLERERQKTTAA